jgi:hypothetical protein
MAIIVEAKDRDRIEVISRQSPEKQISSATKMAKLITSLEKAERRWIASLEKLGSDHTVTDIFRNRVHALRNGAAREEAVIVAKETRVKDKEPEAPLRLGRKKEDFPVGCRIKKLGEDIAGLVTSHEGILDYIMAKFNDTEEVVYIYNIKRA